MWNNMQPKNQACLLFLLGVNWEGTKEKKTKETRIQEGERRWLWWLKVVSTMETDREKQRETNSDEILMRYFSVQRMRRNIYTSMVRGG